MSVTLKRKNKIEDGMFYAYEVGDFKFWFVRHNNGNIYSVTIAPKDTDSSFAEIELYAGCLYAGCPEVSDIREKHFPTEFYMRCNPCVITIANAKEYIEKIAAAAATLEEMKNFFASHVFDEGDGCVVEDKLSLEQFAARLNGREYGDEITDDEINLAEKLGYLVVFGYSDDLIEFRGAIDDEAGCYEGGTIHFTKDGICDEPKCFDARPLGSKQMGCTAKCASVKAVWCPPDLVCSWKYETDLPHAEFDIYEGDDDLYCRGLVIDISSLGSEQ